MKFCMLGLAMASAFLTAPAYAEAPLQFSIDAQNGSGERGTATIVPGAPGSNEIIVIVRLNGAPNDVYQPMHIHQGTCARLNGKPAYALAALYNGRSESKVKGITLADLEKGDYAINVHKSPAPGDIATYVACGNIKPMKSAM